MYYGQFLSLYMKQVFFIDESGPPFGHMILALGGEKIIDIYKSYSLRKPLSVCLLMYIICPRSVFRRI